MSRFLLADFPSENQLLLRPLLDASV